MCIWSFFPYLCVHSRNTLQPHILPICKVCHVNPVLFVRNVFVWINKFCWYYTIRSRLLFPFPWWIYFSWKHVKIRPLILYLTQDLSRPTATNVLVSETSSILSFKHFTVQVCKAQQMLCWVDRTMSVYIVSYSPWCIVASLLQGVWSHHCKQDRRNPRGGRGHGLWTLLCWENRGWVSDFLNVTHKVTDITQTKSDCGLFYVEKIGDE